METGMRLILRPVEVNFMGPTDEDETKRPLLSEGGPTTEDATPGASTPGASGDEVSPPLDGDIESIKVAPGVEKVVVKEGVGDETPQLHAHCFVHYRAWVKKSMQKFEDTWDEGQAMQLNIGQEKATVRGLALGVRSMKASERSLIHVQSSLAYGSEGSFSFPHVPPDSELVYEVELIGFENPKEGRSVAEMTVEERIAAADRRRAEGNELFKNEMYEDAAKQYEMAIGHMNDDFMFQMFGKYRNMANAVRLPCYLNLAACFLKLNRFDDAIGHCSVVLAEEPNNGKALFRRGKARAALGQTETARDDLQKANKLSPKDKAILKELQALKEEDKKSLEKQKRLYKGMFTSPPKAASERIPWYKIVWRWCVAVVKRLWPFKSSDSKRKSE
eukprot:jgi/Mesen1/5329/ME000266S04519